MTETRDVVRHIIDTAHLSPTACASALGVSEEVFDEMVAGQRDIPDSMIPLLAAILGVSESLLTSPARPGRGTDVVPAIWYKLRSEDLRDADRQYVLTVRELAFYQHELERVTDEPATGWKSVFDELRREVDPQSSPSEQGRRAARIFRTTTGLGQGATGIGDSIRGHLRTKGILVIESSAPDSVLEGCSFYVGPSGAERPAIFANSYGTTWFRRNQILMHELAHAVFDVESAIATLDLRDVTSTSIEEQRAASIQEQRADAFAQEALVPIEVLRHLGKGLRWDALTADDVAKLVKDTEVEQRLLAKALLDAGLVTSEVAAFVGSQDISEPLKKLSAHALSTAEYLERAGEGAGIKGRTTTTAPRKVLLPQRYVGHVLAALASSVISRGKAARMLMIDEYELAERFPMGQLAFVD